MILATDVVLRDGSTARVRAAGRGDVAALREFLERLEPGARWFRFFSAGVDLAGAARDAVTPRCGRALLVLTGEDDHVVGHAMFARDGPADVEAEIAFAVAGDWQGRGLATTLLAHLAAAAAADGVTTFVAITMPDNHRMIGVFRDSGFPVEVHAAPGELHIRFPASLTARGRRRFEARERDAAVAAVAHVLRPASVLLAAAVAQRGSAGGEALRNLAAAGFTGTLHAVVGAGEAPAGVARARTIADVPGEVELVVLALAPGAVIEAARACARRGDVRALVVLLEGGGRIDSDQLVAVCRASGMRLLGPDCLGVVNTDPAIALDATFAPVPPARGRVAFASQSGAFGIAALDLAAQHGVGLSSFVSMGAKADLSGNDLLRYWEADEGTDVVLLYLESFGNPRRFGQVARRVTARKPVIAVKSGRAQAAPPDGASRTGALLASSDAHVDALFGHAGVLRTDTLGEMFDLAGLLARQPLPSGDRVALLTNAGGLGVQCADACAAAGLRLVDAVDLSAEASGDDYARALARALADPGVDAVIVLFARSLATPAAAVAAVVDAAAAGSQAQPILAVFMGAGAPALAADAEGCPRFAAPEEAVRALGRALEHARRLARPPDEPGLLEGVDSDRAAAIIATGLAAGAGWLGAPEVEALLHCYGLHTAAGEVAGEGTELLLGIAGDARFGSLVALATGGAMAELAGDAQVRLAPLGPAEADRMIAGLRGFPLLDGFRGRPRADLRALRDAVLRVAALAADHPQLAELDCDPLIAGPSGAVVVAARARLEPQPAQQPYAAVGR